MRQHRVKVIPSINGDAIPVQKVFIRMEKLIFINMCQNFHQQMSEYDANIIFIVLTSLDRNGLHASEGS